MFFEIISRLFSLNDEDLNIKMDTINFVKEELKRDHETVGTDTLTNFQFMIGNFLLPETEDTFLSLVCHLLLGRTGKF